MGQQFALRLAGRLGNVAQVSLALAAWAPLALAQDPPPTDSLLRPYHWRSIGPVLGGGRINDLAVIGGTTIYAGGTGGLWKTVNAGMTWTPLFDEQPSAVVQCLAVAPSDPNTVWVGTGDFIGMLVQQAGRGVFRSVDGGAHWEHVGFRTSEMIGRIAIDPRNPDVVYVGVMGSPTRPGGERGLYRTGDGGKTWERTLAVNEQTGVTDIAIDPTDPNVVYATTWQVATYAHATLGHGPGTGVYKSVDAGRTWRRLSQGLPDRPVARLGIAVSPASPNVVYAVATYEIFDPSTYAGRQSEVFRSDDGGEHWVRGAEVDAASYLGGRIVAHPHEARQVYVPGRGLEHSNDGGLTSARIGGRSPWRPIGEMHLDVRTVWIDPEDDAHLIAATDGGIWFTYDGGAQWAQWENLPLGQFYSVATDMRSPYYVYGGTQDLALYGVPSRTRRDLGILKEDAVSFGGADAFHVIADPVDTNVVYLQNGLPTRRIDHRSSEARSVPILEESGAGRLAPLALSPFDRRTLYSGDTAVYRSRDRGENWTRISPPFLAVADSINLPAVTGQTPADTAANPPATVRRPTVLLRISTIVESPVRSGLIYVGVRDGTIHRTRNGGVIWTTLDPLPGVPTRAQITSVVPSRHAAGTLYAVASGVLIGDQRPFVFKSTDGGGAWAPITGGLPTGTSAWVLVEHPRQPRLLFLGTERGVFVTLDGGARWRPLGSGLPAARISAMTLQPRDNDLVVAVWGRGFYLLDDLGPLEAMADRADRGDLRVFPTRPSVAYVESSAVSGFRPAYGTALPNPAYGAWVHYRLPSGGAPAELVILDRRGRVVRQLEAPNGRGLHRVVWNLRDESRPMSAPSRTPGQDAGVAVPPARYTARLTVGGRRFETPIEVRPDQGGERRPAALAAAYADRKAVGEAEYRLRQVRQRLAGARAAVDSIDGAVRRGGRLNLSIAAIDSVRTGLRAIDIALGPTAGLPLLAGVLAYSTSPLSRSQRAALVAAERALERVGAEIGVMVDHRVKALRESASSGSPPLPRIGRSAAL